MKYNKKILAKHEVFYNRFIEVLVLDDKDYYNIHIIDENYKDDELNTLKLQEPKEYVALDEITNPIKLECYALEHLLWDKFYGFKGKMYSFNVEIADVCEL